MKISYLIILSFSTLSNCGFINTNQERCEDLPDSNAVSYDSSNLDSEMIDAARTQKTELLKCLVHKGANINAEKDGITALIYAGAYGSFDIVKFLIANRADVNAENSEGQNVLAFAASSAYTAAILGKEDHEKMVRYLITEGNAKVNAVSKTGNTALIWAARNGHLNIVELLLKFDADINIVNKKGYSALLWATQNQHYETSKKLVESGADVNAVIFEGDFAGFSAVTFAYRRADNSLVDYFVKNGAKASTETMYGYCSDEYLSIPDNVECN